MPSLHERQEMARPFWALAAWFLGFHLFFFGMLLLALASGGPADDTNPLAVAFALAFGGIGLAVGPAILMQRRWGAIAAAGFGGLLLLVAGVRLIGVFAGSGGIFGMIFNAIYVGVGGMIVYTALKATKAARPAHGFSPVLVITTFLGAMLAGSGFMIIAGEMMAPSAA
jgi:hypothetical protein